MGLAGILNGIAILRVRAWNPSQEVRGATQEAAERESIWGEEYNARQLLDARTGGQTTQPAGRGSVHAAPGKRREVWDNAILWREVRTWAYGRKVLFLRLAYLLLFGLAAAATYALAHRTSDMKFISASLALVPLFVLSLVLVNAQAVTALTSERDGRALDLLLVTDLTAKEFVFGKLGGVLYNTKEMVLLPMALCAYLWYERALSGENLFYLVGGLAAMNAFVAMLGVHTGMAYSNSRSAIGVSLGTLFFSVHRHRHLHADDDRLQRLVPRAVAAVPGVHAGRRRRAVRGLGAQSVAASAGRVHLPVRDVLRDHQLLAALHRWGRVLVRRGRLRVHGPRC